MPIGFDNGDAGGGYSSRPPVTRSTPLVERDNDPRTRTTIRARSEIDVKILDRFYTAGDERTCPICAPLNGTIYWDGTGPYPPLHHHCRCVRVPDFEFVTVRLYWEEVTEYVY